MSCQSLAASANNAARVKNSVTVISMTMPSMRVVPAAKLNPWPIKRQQSPYYRTITGHTCNRSADWGLACLLHFSFFFFCLLKYNGAVSRRRRLHSSSTGLHGRLWNARYLYKLLNANSQTRPKMTLLSKLTGLEYNSGSWRTKSGHMRALYTSPFQKHLYSRLSFYYFQEKVAKPRATEPDCVCVSAHSFQEAATAERPWQWNRLRL